MQVGCIQDVFHGKDAFSPYFEPVVRLIPNFEFGKICMDGGLFAIQYVKEVVQNPDTFLQLCMSGNLLEWFNIQKVRKLRGEISELVSLKMTVIDSS